MTQVIHTTREQVFSLVHGSFPLYQGKYFRVQAVNSVTFADLNWSGGTKSQYRAVSLDGSPLGSMDRHNQVAPWCNVAEGATVDLPRGACIVRHSVFCGKDTGLTFYIRPEDMPKSLTDQSVELGGHETIVLVATRSFKASYGGKDRYEMARESSFYGDEARHCAEFPTRLQWDLAKADLIARGLLDRRGAITILGRNAIAGRR